MWNFRRQIQCEYRCAGFAQAPCDLYHSALAGVLPDVGPFVVEMTPVPRGDGRTRAWSPRGVGARAAGRLRIFLYEVRRWPGGVIPDVAEAVESPVRLTEDGAIVRRIWDLVPALPTPVWGRDELHAGGMWNSNSVIAWLIARSGLAVESIRPPAGGRAPGWSAGVAAARGMQAVTPSPAPRREAVTRAAAAIFEPPAGWRSGRTHRS